MTVIKPTGPVNKPAKSIRIDAANPNHHLYNNNGTWWIHFTEWASPSISRRIRRSLNTNDLRSARCLRDEILMGGVA